MSPYRILGELRPEDAHYMQPRGSLAMPEPVERLAARRLLGAYDSAGELDRRSVRWTLPFVDGKPPPAVSEMEVVEEIDEEVVWGGVLLAHYGHFMLESVGRLWPLVSGQSPKAQRMVFGGKLQTAPNPTAAEWLQAFGADQVTLPSEGAVRFTRMIVPEMAWRLRSWCCPEIRDVHLQARRGLCISPSRLPRDIVWLSRSELSANRTPFDECLLEWLLEDHVSIVHPEHLSLAEQVGILEDSRAVVGVNGSAFHSLLLAERIPTCLYLCGAQPKPGYIAQHDLLDSRATFAVQCIKIVPPPHPSQANMSFPGGYRLDIPRVLGVLSTTLLPELLDEPRLAAFADPASRRSASSRSAADGLDDAVHRMLLEPNSAEVRRRLGAAFDSAGLERCAREQLAIVARLEGGH